MDIILLGIGVGFGLYIVVSLLGYSIRAMIKLLSKGGVMYVVKNS